MLLLLFVIYTTTKFPYTYITMEGDDFWVLTWDFWLLKLASLPAVTTWIAEYLMQFYSSPYIAATIEALVLGATGLLAYLTLSNFKGDPSGKKASPRGDWVVTLLPWLALIPPVLLGFYCTFNLSFQLQCLFFFGLLESFLLIPNTKGKFLFSIACVPVGFLLMRTPMLGLLLLIQYFLIYITNKYSIIWNCPIILFSVTPLVYSQQVAFIPFEKRYTELGTDFAPLTSRYIQGGEYLKKCVCLANEGRWEDLLYKEHVRRDAQSGMAVSLRYALLAECALGTLPENLFLYPIQEESQFFYPHSTERVASQFNRLFYLNLGVNDEAFHQAQEYGLIQPNGSCFSSLRQMVEYSIEEGDLEIADKFLHILSKSSCHKKFIEDSRLRIQDSRRSHLQRGSEEGTPLRADNFVGGYPLPVEMLRLARYYENSPHRKKMLDYAVCSYMLRGNVNNFLIAIKAFDIYKDKELPKAYREFLERYSSTASTTSPISNPLESR